MDANDMYSSILPVNDLPSQGDTRTGYFKLYEDDQRLETKATELFADQLNLIDEIMTLLYETIVIDFAKVDVWGLDEQRRFTHAGVNASFSYLIFARKSIVQGYFYEVQLALRSALEWYERAGLFHEDATAVEKFVLKGKLSDSEVRLRLKNVLEERSSGTGTTLRLRLNRLHGRYSNLGHANFQSLALRAFTRAPVTSNTVDRQQLAKSMGTGFVFGGYLTREIAYASFIDMIELSEALLQISMAQFPELKSELRPKQKLLRERAEFASTSMRKALKRAEQEI